MTNFGPPLRPPKKKKKDEESPLKLTSTDVFDENVNVNRLGDLADGILRYIAVNSAHKIPDEWIFEVQLRIANIKAIYQRREQGEVSK